MGQNRYDILHFEPVLQAGELAPDLEMLAQQLASSGLLRIHSDEARNFIIYSGSGFDMSFSRRELWNPGLLARTSRRIAATLPGSAGRQGVEDMLAQLRERTKTIGEMSQERELAIARLLVQAAEPVVIQLILLEKVDIYVSYSHNVADLMALHFWESMKGNGGLQAVSGDGAAVYVSCGGNPFITKEEQRTYTTDGWPALARMLVIAGQELGHYADLRRDQSGHVIGRHSANLRPLQAHPAIAAARLADLAQVRQWQQLSAELGLAGLYKLEQSVTFYREHRRYSLTRLWQEWRLRKGRREFLQRAESADYMMALEFPILPRQPHLGYNLAQCLQDMEFNLAPEADAYFRESPAEHEAILCIEALARVPQQVVKWGHPITRLCWPQLYKVYYDEIIPHCAESYELLSGKRYHPLGRRAPDRPSRWKRLIAG